MKKIIFLSLFFIFSAYADECEEKYIFKINGEKNVFCLLKDSKMLVNSQCQKTKCHALKIINSVEFKKIKLTSKELSGGKNPSTKLCKKISGALQLGVSENGDEQYFCEFPDKSIISTSSLFLKYTE